METFFYSYFSVHFIAINLMCPKNCNDITLENVIGPELSYYMLKELISIFFQLQISKTFGPGLIELKPQTENEGRRCVWVIRKR